MKENQTAEFKYSNFLSWSHFIQLQFSGTLWEKDKRKIKLEQEFEYHLMVSFYHYSASLSLPELPCPNPPLLILQTQGYLSHFRHIDFCWRNGETEKREGKVIFVE